jgi:hypothetical protein
MATTLVLLALGVSAPAAHGQTQWLPWLGGSGGQVTNNLGCPADQRLVGLYVRHGTVIDGLQAKCVATNNGAWASSQGSLLPTQASTNNPSPASSWSNIDCPQHQYVSGLRVYHRKWTGAKDTAIARISLRCRPATAVLAPAGTTTLVQGGAMASGGSWSSVAQCPDNLPFGDAIETNSGWYVDQLRLRCRAPLATPGSASPSPGALPPPDVHGTERLPLMRRLTAAERRLAEQVFRGTINYDLLRVTDTLGLYSRPWVANTPPMWLMNVGPTHYQDLTKAPAFFIHELTHVWQGQHGVPITANSAIHQGLAVLQGGNFNDAYQYNCCSTWNSYNIEQQARIVGDWFSNGMNTADPLYPYIRDHIRAGKAF